MIATIDDFVSHVVAHAGADAELAERASRAVLAAVGGYLGPAARELVASELPPPLRAVVEGGSDLATPLEAHVVALGTTTGHARELIASVYRVLAEALSREALAALRAAMPMPPGLAHVLDAPSPGESGELPRAGRPRDTLAAGQPGSHHPVSAARVPAGHSESVAADNPHASTKLSSSSGTTQERLHETIAEGQPGAPAPIAETRR
jgi:uncharacterized protein (DUF2267 family)